jgi:hypothetical protein
MAWLKRAEELTLYHGTGLESLELVQSAIYTDSIGPEFIELLPQEKT